MDVKELLESKNIPYKIKGKDYVVSCLSPEHDDANPSMNINILTGIFHCLSCSYSGDIYKTFNINKEQFIGLKLQKVKDKIENLQSTKPLTIPLDAVYISNDFRDISKNTLRKYSAFTTESIEKMQGRIVFPISNINRDIKAFIGRYMYSDLEPRYDIEPSGRNLPLFPSIVVPIQDSIILVEGIFDMLNLHDKGLHNAVCTFGTAFGSVKNPKGKKRNIDRLLQYKYQGINRVIIMYDGDKSGRDASKNLYNYIKYVFNTNEYKLEEDKDPGKLTLDEINKIYGELYG